MPPECRPSARRRDCFPQRTSATLWESVIAASSKKAEGLKAVWTEARAAGDVPGGVKGREAALNQTFYATGI